MSSARAWSHRARKFWDQRQRQAEPGGLTGYLLDESPPAIGRHRFEGEWGQVQGWLKRYGVSGGACLDVGCGTGIWLKAFAPHFKSLEGWDYAPAMVAASRQTLKSVRHARLHCGDITRRKGNAVFDLIFVGGVLMYTPEPALAPLLKALRRLLKPGGLLIVRESTLRGATVVREGLPLQAGVVANARQKKDLDYVAIYRSVEVLRARLAEAGLTVAEVRPNSHYKLSDLTREWILRLGLTDKVRAEKAAQWIYRARVVLLYPEYYLRPWKLKNHWFLATSSTLKSR